MMKKQPKIKPLTASDLMKLEVVAELGLLEKVQRVGWGGLTARESGCVGGAMIRRIRALAKKEGELRLEDK